MCYILLCLFSFYFRFFFVICFSCILFMFADCLRLTSRTNAEQLIICGARGFCFLPLALRFLLPRFTLSLSLHLSLFLLLSLFRFARTLFALLYCAWLRFCCARRGRRRRLISQLISGWRRKRIFDISPGRCPGPVWRLTVVLAVWAVWVLPKPLNPAVSAGPGPPLRPTSGCDL